MKPRRPKKFFVGHVWERCGRGPSTSYRLIVEPGVYIRRVGKKWFGYVGEQLVAREFEREHAMRNVVRIAGVEEKGLA